MRQTSTMPRTLSPLFPRVATRWKRPNGCCGISNQRAFFIASSCGFDHRLHAQQTTKGMRLPRLPQNAVWLPSPEGMPCETSGAEPTGRRRSPEQLMRESCARFSLIIAHTFRLVARQRKWHYQFRTLLPLKNKSRGRKNGRGVFYV